MDNYYQLLGVTRNATAVEVKAAFQAKMKALESSPVHGEHRQNQEKMLQQAFLTLLDPRRRARYDRQVDTAAGPVVVLEDVPPPKGVSVVTVVFVTALLAAAVAGGWYVTHPSAAKQEAAAKEEEARSRAARARVETAGPKGNPNPLRNAPASEMKDRVIRKAVERETRQGEVRR
jgi:hypothetical protein